MMVNVRPLRTALKRPAHSNWFRFLQRSRRYHSYDHEASPPFTPAEDAILSAALSHVPAHGFTNAALTKGARDAGYLDVSTNLFPTGAFSIVNYHLVIQRLALAKHAPSTPQTHSDVSSNIRTLALRRLQANKPIIHQWQDVRQQGSLYTAALTVDPTQVLSTIIADCFHIN